METLEKIDRFCKREKVIKLLTNPFSIFLFADLYFDVHGLKCFNTMQIIVFIYRIQGCSYEER